MSRQKPEGRGLEAWVERKGRSARPEMLQALAPLGSQSLTSATLTMLKKQRVRDFEALVLFSRLTDRRQIRALKEARRPGMMFGQD